MSSCAVQSGLGQSQQAPGRVGPAIAVLNRHNQLERQAGSLGELLTRNPGRPERPAQLAGQYQHPALLGRRLVMQDLIATIAQVGQGPASHNIPLLKPGGARASASPNRPPQYATCTRPKCQISRRTAGRAKSSRFNTTHLFARAANAGIIRKRDCCPKRLSLSAPANPCAQSSPPATAPLYQNAPPRSAGVVGVFIRTMASHGIWPNR